MLKACPTTHASVSRAGRQTETGRWVEPRTAEPPQEARRPNQKPTSLTKKALLDKEDIQSSFKTVFLKAKVTL